MANPSGKICLGFNMGNPDHEQVKKILDSLPKGAKSNFIAAAVLEYWARRDNVIDARDYRKHDSAAKRLPAGSADDNKLPEKPSAAPPTATRQAGPIATNPEAPVSDPVPADVGNDQSGEDEKLEEILIQGLRSFK